MYGLEGDLGLKQSRVAMGGKSRPPSDGLAAVEFAIRLAF